MARNRLLFFLFLALFSGGPARADELTRQVQEELRKRHLFFRDIDGRPSLDYAIALKRYQARQGFAVSGIADEMTLYSLGIGEPIAPAEGAADLPNVPVLKSDAALPDTRPRPAPIPTKDQTASDVTKAEIRDFLRRYFEACQSASPQDELAFYADRVAYYDHHRGQILYSKRIGRLQSAVAGSEIHDGRFASRGPSGKQHSCESAGGVPSGEPDP